MVGRPLIKMAAIVGFSFLGAVGSSCSLAFDLGREQCETADDCAEVGFAATCQNKVCVAISEGGGGQTGQGGQGGQGGEDPHWSCLGGFQPPAPGPGGLVAYHYRIELAVNPGVPPPDLAVQLCGLLDFNCTSPLPIDPPDADGNVMFEIGADVEAYLDITATDLKPTRAYLPVPPVVMPPKEKVIRVVREMEFANIVATSGKTYDPTRGTAIMLTVDCNDDRAANVQLQTDDLDSQTISYYFKGQLPNFTVTETDLQGAGGWVNLPVGLVNARAVRASNGEAIGSASFESRANGLAYVPIGPTPGAQ